MCLPYACLHSSKVSDLPSPLPPPSPAPRRLACAVLLCCLPPRLPPGPSPPWAISPTPSRPHHLARTVSRQPSPALPPAPPPVPPPVPPPAPPPAPSRGSPHPRRLLRCL